jgi:hypothetical protein
VPALVARLHEHGVRRVPTSSGTPWPPLESLRLSWNDADALPRNGEVPVWTSSSPGTSSTASVKAHTKIPTGTLFASDHPSALEPSTRPAKGNDCGLRECWGLSHEGEA